MTTTKLVQLPVGRTLTAVHGMEMAEFTLRPNPSRLKMKQTQNITNWILHNANRMDIEFTFYYETRKRVGKQHSLLFIDVKQTGLPFYSGKPKFVYKFPNFGRVIKSQSSRKYVIEKLLDHNYFMARRC